MKKFAEENSKSLIYAVAMVISVTIIASVGFSYAAPENNSNIYTRDELSNMIVELRETTSSENMFLNNYPIGSIYITTTNTNPSSVGGTWVSFGTGKTIVGVDTAQTEFNIVEKTGGEKTHVLSGDEMPRHYHSVYVKDFLDRTYENVTASYFGAIHNSAFAYNYSAGVANVAPVANTDYKGDNLPHNNLQPYITVYMWKRTG